MSERFRVDILTASASKFFRVDELAALECSLMLEFPHESGSKVSADTEPPFLKPTAPGLDHDDIRSGLLVINYGWSNLRGIRHWRANRLWRVWFGTGPLGKFWLSTRIGDGLSGDKISANDKLRGLP